MADYVYMEPHPYITWCQLCMGMCIGPFCGAIFFFEINANMAAPEITVVVVICILTTVLDLKKKKTP